MSAGGLAALVGELAASLAVEERTEGAATTWWAGGRAFAALSGAALECRLDPIVGAAARRTPDTGASERGSDWVRFEPVALDQYAGDRARAWFAAAYRRAIG